MRISGFHCLDCTITGALGGLSTAKCDCNGLTGALVDPWCAICWSNIEEQRGVFSGVPGASCASSCPLECFWYFFFAYLLLLSAYLFCFQSSCFTRSAMLSSSQQFLFLFFKKWNSYRILSLGKMKSPAPFQTLASDQNRPPFSASSKKFKAIVDSSSCTASESQSFNSIPVVPLEVL